MFIALTVPCALRATRQLRVVMPRHWATGKVSLDGHCTGWGRCCVLVLGSTGVLLAVGLSVLLGTVACACPWLLFLHWCLSGFPGSGDCWSYSAQDLTVAGALLSHCASFHIHNSYMLIF